MARPIGRVGTVVLALAGALSWVSVAGWQEPRPRLPATGAGLIIGQVLDADTALPVAGAQVSITGPAGSLVITDSQGRFYFAALPAGSYRVVPSRAGYGSVAAAQPIKLANGERIGNAQLRLSKLGTISGVVRDEAGDPVVGTEVIAYRRFIFQGRPAAFIRTARDRSDDRGVYRLKDLPVSEYYICACNRDSIPFDGPLLTTLAARPLELMGVARRAAEAGADAASIDDTLRTYPPTFHPNTPLASRATRVPLGAGENRTAIDIDVPAVRAARVSGTIIGGGGPSIAASMVRLIPANDLPEAAAITLLEPMLLQPDGRFDFAGIPPGQYTLVVLYNGGARVSGPSGAALGLLGARGSAMTAPIAPVPIDRSAPPAPTEQLWASEAIVVGETDVTGLVVGLNPGITLRGRVEYAGASLPPGEQELRRAGVNLMPATVGLLQTRGGAASLRPNGSFEVPNLVPGRYAVYPTVAAPWRRVLSITVGGVDVIDTGLVIDPKDSGDMVVTMTDAPGATIKGSTLLKPGESAEGIEVCLFPTDRRLWLEPFVALRRYSAAQLTASGEFTLSGLPPGEYFVAIHRTQGSGAGGPSVDWIDAPVLESLARTAQRVRIADDETRVMVLKR